MPLASPRFVSFGASLVVLLLSSLGGAQATSTSAPSTPAAVPSAPGSSTISVEICVQAFDEVQERRNGGQLRAARSSAAMCSNAVCPAVIRDKCLPWLDELNAEIPSVLIRAIDPRGADTLDVRVLAAGEELAARLDGRPLELDPGAHTLRFEHPGATPVEQTVVIQAGTKGRPLSVSFQAAEAEPAPGGGAGAPSGTASSTGFDIWNLPTLVYVGAGATAAGLLVGGIAGAVAVADKSSLDDRCASVGCSEDDISASQTSAHVSTAGFVLAGAGIALGASAFILLSPSGDETSEVAIELTPLGGALRGRF